ncbi:MAG: heme exporter protein CcmB [Pseudomonadales bacterium]|nr:heme exporter protein CcmB [Pseudomonadales bacterium]
MLLATLRRDLIVHIRNTSDVLNPLVFFVIVVSLFPLAVSPGRELLGTIAPGVVWVAALLATLLSADQMFRSDFDDGSLEQMAVSREPLILIVVARVIAHWLVTGLVLTMLSPLLGMMLYLTAEGRIALALSLLLGTPVLSLVGSIGAALTVGLKRGGVLTTILVLPLYVPVLILGTSMVATGNIGGDYSGHMLWLGAMLALSAGLAPIAGSASLRISLSQ